MILKVARIGHPVVRSAARDVPAEVLASSDFQHLVDDMVDTMHEYNGVGLAGPQVHVAGGGADDGMTDARDLEDHRITCRTRRGRRR